MNGLAGLAGLARLAGAGTLRIFCENRLLAEISKGLRPTPPPRVVFFYAYSECLHIRCSCGLFLGHLVCFFVDFSSFFGKETATNVSESG